MIRHCLLSTLYAAIIAVPGAHAQDTTTLVEDTPITREIGPDQTHTFRVELSANQFVLGEADQHDIDVVVRINGPDGEEISEFDSPARGPETFSFSTPTAGTYDIVVASFDDDETGSYTIRLDRVEAVATTRDGRVDQLFAAWDRPGSPGAAVAVAQNGRILYEAGYGEAQVEYGIPIEPTTIFHVASVSKQLTGFAIAMLADQRRLSLDDDIRMHLPELPDLGTTVTIRHLLHHTSGWRDQWALLGLAGWRLDDVITRDQILRLLTRQRELNFPPGSEYLYSNSGYTMAAEIVARVTDQSFADWTREHLFEPLGMTRTHFHDDHEMLVPGRAYSYAHGDRGLRKSVLSYANAGATSLFTTAGDLARWMHNLETGTVGGPEVLRMMHTRGVLASGDTIDYALGLGRGEFKGLATVAHGGADAGFRSSVLRFPEHGLSIAVLSNLASFNPGRLAQQLAEIYLEQEIAAAEAAEPEAPEPVRVEVRGELLDAYAGDYELEGIGLRITFARDGDDLLVQPRGEQQLALTAESDSVFTLAQEGARIAFVPETSGVVNRLRLTQGGQTITGYRLGTAPQVTIDLAEYAGTYDSPELETSYRLVVKNDTLIAEHVRHDSITLARMGPDRFRGNVWFFGPVRFERDAAGAITGMRVSNGRVRDLLFVRREESEP